MNHNMRRVVGELADKGSTVKAGGEHTLFRSTSGELYSCGACGIGWSRLHSLWPSLFGWRHVPLPEPCRLFHASYYHNLAVGARTGRLYSWGCGTFTEGGLDGVIPALGCGRDAQDLGGLPEQVNMRVDDIADISGGAYHSVILMASGSIVTFGAGQLGQLGRPAAAADASGLPADPLPGKIVDLPKSEIPVGVGAGFYNTFVRCKSGKLYCTGENQNQQCGAGPKNLYSLRHVKEVHDVAEVSGGYCHTLVRTFGGAVFSLGCGDDGQRGDSKPGDTPDRPAVSLLELPNQCKAVAIAAGANHSVVLGDDGIAYTFGANDVGQCGVCTPGGDRSAHEDFGDDDDDIDENDSLLAPQPVPLPPGAGGVTAISAGYAHTTLQTSSGRLFVFGQNDNGQLGLGEGFSCDEPEPQVEPTEVTCLPKSDA